MSAKLEMEATHWEEMERIGQETENCDLSAIEMESLLRNMDERNVVRPLREARATVAQMGAVKDGAIKRREALALQEQWNGWLMQREQLREEIKRGKECLERVRNEIAVTRARLEEWPEYERECGKNPLFHYMECLIASERIEQFLPGWLDRRENKLANLRQQMEAWAKANGMAEQVAERL